MAHSDEAPAESDPSQTAVSCSPSIAIEQDGIALSSFPSSSHLSRSVSIGSPSEVSGTTCWTATSNVKWLTVVPSGKKLTITADPVGIKTDIVRRATVTLTSSATVGQTATINVALWIGSTDPAVVTLSQSAVSIAANPVDPVAYVSAGASSINVYNVYTGQLITTFGPVAPTVGFMAVSSDGTTLFAVDTTNYEIVALDAKAGHVMTRYPLVGPISGDFSFAFAKPSGQATLFAPGQSAIDVGSGQAVSKPITITNGFYDPLIAATPNGKRLAILERGLSPGSIYMYSVSRGAKRQLTVDQTTTSSIVGENCQAMAISADGSRVYPACGAPYEFDVYDGATLIQVQTLPAVPYPDNAAIDSNGDFVGGVNGLYEVDDVFVFDVKGYSLGVVPTTSESYAAGQGSNLLAVSGDSTRVISATAAVYGAQTLMFRTLP